MLVPKATLSIALGTMLVVHGYLAVAFLPPAFSAKVGIG
jgi:hypothetical protein